MTEPQQVAERYARRQVGDRYSLLRPEVWQMVHERQRAMLGLFVLHGVADLSALRLLEVGCGQGGNLLELLRLGFSPDKLGGIELLPERLAQARACLPSAVVLHEGDAVQAPIADASQDIVFAATVFSSLLDDGFQQQLAAAMWRWVKPGGAVLWYDFTVDNPRNPDVRGVPFARLKALFPHGRIDRRRVTLAPPIARLVCRGGAGWYPVFNAIPLLRTHVLAWIGK
jgi:SAM-dependent methyltransferase